MRSPLNGILRVCLFTVAAIISQGVIAHADHHKHAYEWPNGAKTAVVLTYDDSVDSHLDIAIPQLNQQGLLGSFYINGIRDSYAKRMDEWRQAALAGHELGNHTWFHPCQKSKPDRDWVQPEYDLDTYSLQRYMDEISTLNVALGALDGKTDRTFAYPCAELNVEGKDLVEAIQPLVFAARAGDEGGFNNPHSYDRFRIRGYDATGRSGDELIAAVESALGNQKFIVMVFHGVGGDYLTVTAEDHSKFLRYLATNKHLYWVTTLKELVQYTSSRADKY